MKKIFGFLALLILCNSAFAQEKNVSLDLKDAPVRTCLEMAFKQADINNFVIDNNVAGFVTMTITDQPFEVALKLIMRGASTPLTYTKENNVYIVKPRRIVIDANPDPNFYSDLLMETNRNSITWERIPLTFIDPFDLMSAFGNIILISQFYRSGGMNGSNMGGFGGGSNNNSFGGGGGIGGGMGMGFGGGGMGNAGGMMGGMGGMMGGMGMGGGMGGFGGGRNF